MHSSHPLLHDWSDPLAHAAHAHTHTHARMKSRTPHQNLLAPALVRDRKPQVDGFA